MAITKFTKPVCRSLSQEFAAALAELAAKHGLKVEAAGGALSDTEYTAKFKFSVTDQMTVAKKEVEDFNLMCGMFGMDASHYGKTFKYMGAEWELVGFTTRAKYPAKARNADGKTMFFGETVLENIRLLNPVAKPDLASLRAAAVAAANKG